MTGARWNVLILSFALFVSAHGQTCPPPLEYPPAKLDTKTLNRHKFSNGDKAYYSCDEDHTPSRGSRSVQCYNGKWSRLTLKCEKKSCGNAGDLPNGYYVYEGHPVIGEKVFAECNDGYTLRGLNFLTCKKSGWSGDTPFCEEEKVTCSTPTVANSKMTGGASVYKPGNKLTFTCSWGFQLDGAEQITCGPDGQWRPTPPQCLPSPEKSRCGVPLNNPESNSHLADKFFSRTYFTSGNRVYYMCDIGYSQVGGSRYRKCTNGKWSPLLLKCERQWCGSAGEISYGHFTYTGVQFGDTATAVCDRGYQLVGQATRTCVNGGWDGRVPVCEAVVCDEPPAVTNAKRTAPVEPPYVYRTVVSYRCLVGTVIGPKDIHCTEDGTWSSAPPECKEITCPIPNVPNASWVRAETDQYRDKDTISIVCNPRFRILGRSVITCGRDGKWHPDLPSCRLRPKPLSQRTYWNS